MGRASAQLIKLDTARSDAITELELPKHSTGRFPAARRLLCGFRAPNCLSKPAPTDENWSANEHDSPEQLQRAEIVGALFELADADRDGQISPSELDMLLTLLELPVKEQPPTVLDFVANDSVTVEQFTSLVGGRFIPPELTATWARTLASAFAEVDKDHSGALDAMEVTRMVGLTLTPVDPERAFVISALARAALQLGNPTAPDTRYNIDPLRRASRLRLFVAALLWKGKAMLMTALVKLMLKRMLARAASEELLQSASVPVIGICDAAVLHLALLDCLAVAQAPILTARMLDALVLRFGTARVTPPIRLALFRAIGCAIVRIEAHHPACALLLTHLERLVGRPLRTDVLDDEALFLAQLPALQPHAQQLTLRLLFIALATDGMINPLERELLLKGARLCPAVDFARAEAAIDDTANALVDGRSLDVQVAFRLFPLSGERSDDGGEDVNSDSLKQASCADVCMRAATATMRAMVRASRKAFKVIC